VGFSYLDSNNSHPLSDRDRSARGAFDTIAVQYAGKKHRDGVRRTAREGKIAAHVTSPSKTAHQPPAASRQLPD
jgi:hypothetical protein